MPYCPNCGKEVTPGSAFCPSCGVSQQPSPAPLPTTGKPRPGKKWYLLPILLSLLGGVIMGFSLRNRDRRMAVKGVILGLIIFAIIIVPGVVGYVALPTGEGVAERTVTAPAPAEVPVSSELPSVITQNELRDMVIDVPAGYVLADRAARTINDLAPEALELGWIEGYRVIFVKQDGNLESWIQEDISRYPTQKDASIAFGLSLFPEAEKIVDPGIGDSSELNILTDEFGRSYVLVFTKGDLLVTLSMWGTITDVEFLTSIAQNAHSKLIQTERVMERTVTVTAPAPAQTAPTPPAQTPPTATQVTPLSRAEYASQNIPLSREAALIWEESTQRWNYLVEVDFTQSAILNYHEDVSVLKLRSASVLEKLETIQAPSEFSISQGYFLNAVRLQLETLTIMAEISKDGSLTGDLDSIERATELTRQATEQANLATTALREAS